MMALQSTASTSRLAVLSPGGRGASAVLRWGPGEVYGCRQLPRACRAALPDALGQVAELHSHLEGLQLGESSGSSPQVAAQLVADLASNLGVLDPGEGDMTLADSWDAARDLSAFEPGVRVDPLAIFACALLGLFGLDATLQSMNIPFIGSRVSRYLADKKREERKRQMEEYNRAMAERTAAADSIRADDGDAP